MGRAEGTLGGVWEAFPPLNRLIARFPSTNQPWLGRRRSSDSSLRVVRQDVLVLLAGARPCSHARSRIRDSILSDVHYVSERDYGLVTCYTNHSECVDSSQLW